MWEATGPLPRIPDGPGFPVTGSAMTAGEKYGCEVIGKKGKIFVDGNKQKENRLRGRFLFAIVYQLSEVKNFIDSVSFY